MAIKPPTAPGPLTNPAATNDTAPIGLTDTPDVTDTARIVGVAAGTPETVSFILSCTTQPGIPVIASVNTFGASRVLSHAVAGRIEVEYDRDHDGTLHITDLRAIPEDTPPGETYDTILGIGSTKNVEPHFDLCIWTPGTAAMILCRIDAPSLSAILARIAARPDHALYRVTFNPTLNVATGIAFQTYADELPPELA